MLPYQINLFPDFENVFIETDKLGRYVFFPLATINFIDHPILKDNTYHIIALWDTGNYEKNYLNDYRQDIYYIKFDYIQGKYAYKAPIIFPSVDFLPEAFESISNDFLKNIDFHLKPKEYNEFNFSDYCTKNGLTLKKKFPNMSEWDLIRYYKIVTEYLLSKERYKRYNTLNSKATYSYFKNESYNKHTKEYLKENFNSMGIKNFDSFLEKPDWVKQEYKPAWGEYQDQVFIAHVDAGDFIYSDSTMLNLFFNKKQNQAIQVFEWD